MWWREACLERTRERRFAYWKKYYETNKEQINLKTKKRREEEISSLKGRIIELERELQETKDFWLIEIKTCNRYREKCEQYEKYIKQLSDSSVKNFISNKYKDEKRIQL